MVTHSSGARTESSNVKPDLVYGQVTIVSPSRFNVLNNINVEEEISKDVCTSTLIPETSFSTKPPQHNSCEIKVPPSRILPMRSSKQAQQFQGESNLKAKESSSRKFGKKQSKN